MYAMRGSSVHVFRRNLGTATVAPYCIPQRLLLKPDSLPRP